MVPIWAELGSLTFECELATDLRRTSALFGHYDSVTQAGFARSNDRPCSVRYLEFAKDAGDMIADRFRAHHKALRDRSVVVALGNQRQDLALALRQVVEGGRWRGRALRTEEAHEALRYGWTEQRLSTRHRPQDAEQLGLIGSFENVAPRAGAHRSENRVVVSKHREHHHGR
jgi:hypothetical protein